MLILRNTTDKQTLLIPNEYQQTGIFTLEIVNTIDKTKVHSQAVMTQRDLMHYVEVVVQLPEGLAAGEYEYNLFSADERISTGLMIITDDQQEVKSYTEETKYTQYEI